MKKGFKYFFDKSWRPILFWFLACLILGISEIVKNAVFGNVALAIFSIGLLVILIASVYEFFRGKWLLGILNLGLFGITIFVFIFYAILLFFIEQETPDTWADNLKMPTNIPIENPVDLEFNEQRPDSVTNRPVSSIDFQLYNSFQPGLYEYDFWINKIDSGKIYLKAFEITQNYALSTDRLPISTLLKLYNPTDSIIKFRSTRHFTIYEGDWGKPYAARFEVWFKPHKGGAERKLFSKNYKIEGWMR